MFCFVLFFFLVLFFIAHYPHVSSKRTHTTGYATWVNTRVMATQFWCRSVIFSVIQSGFILQSFILHSYFTFFCLLSFISQSKIPPSELPIIKLIKICSILMVEETGVPGGNHVFVERLYSVHFVRTRPTRKVDHHDCVCHNNKWITVSGVCLYFGIGEE
jgi:hypothetical protein